MIRILVKKKVFDLCRALGMGKHMNCDDDLDVIFHVKKVLLEINCH